jgi:hypothetical protein
MTQVLDPLPSSDSEVVLCCYVNATSKIQVARVTNVPDWYFERVVFPGQRLLFEAVKTANLEIHTGMMASSILSDTISCLTLAVEADSALEEPTPVEEDEATADESSSPFYPPSSEVSPVVASSGVAAGAIASNGAL